MSLSVLALTEKHLKEEKYVKLNYEFHNNCLSKNLFGKISRLVKTAKDTYQEDLDIRRNRLRQLIDTEENNYEKEFRVYVASRLENTIRLRQEMLFKIRNEKLKEEADFNKLKLAEQTMANSDIYLTKVNKESLKESKRLQLLQIEENKQKRINEKLEDCMWLDVRDRLWHEYDKKRDYENCLRKAIEMKTEEYNYCKGEFKKKPIDMSSDYYEGGGALLKYDEKIEQDKINKRKQIAKQNNIYNFKADELKKSKNCRELEIIDMFNEANKREHEEILKKSNDKKIKDRREIETYLQYSRDIKIELDKEKCEEDQIILADQRRTECIELEKYKKWKKNREDYAKKCHQIRIEQMLEKDRKKHDSVITDHEQSLIDIELRNRQYCKDNEKICIRKNKELDLAAELLKQKEEKRQREYEFKKQDNETYQYAIKYGEQQDKLAEEFSKEYKRNVKHPNFRLMECSCSNS